MLPKIKRQTNALTPNNAIPETKETSREIKNTKPLKHAAEYHCPSCIERQKYHNWVEMKNAVAAPCNLHQKKCV